MQKPIPNWVKEVAQDLWGSGYAVIPRPSVEALLDSVDYRAPMGMSYQWNEADAVKRGWKHVPLSRHPGLFAPLGMTGDIECNGLFLMEKPTREVEAFHAESHRKAQQNVDDWFARQGAAGFTGGVRVLTEGSSIPRSDDSREINHETKTIESKTEIPPDMFPHLSAIFAERDRLWRECSDQPWEPGNSVYDKFQAHSILCPELPRGAVMNAILTPIAIENVRKSLKGAEHDDAQGNEEPGRSAEARSPAEGPATGD